MVKFASSGLSSTRSITFSPMLIPPGNLSVQREIECRSFFFGAFRPYLSSVPMNDALDNGQANAGTWKLFNRMQPLKCSKQLFSVLHIETGSIVAHKVGLFIAILFNTKLYLCPGVFAGQLPGIIHQVF